MPEYEPDDFSLSLSFSSLPILHSWELFQLNARGLMAICFLQPLWPPRTPQMDPILGVHWNYPSCPLPIPTEKDSSPLMPHGNQVIEGTFFIYSELMSELVTDKLKSWLIFLSWWCAIRTEQHLESLLLFFLNLHLATNRKGYNTFCISFYILNTSRKLGIHACGSLNQDSRRFCYYIVILYGIYKEIQNAMVFSATKGG